MDDIRIDINTLIVFDKAIQLRKEGRDTDVDIMLDREVARLRLMEEERKQNE